MLGVLGVQRVHRGLNLKKKRTYKDVGTAKEHIYKNLTVKATKNL